MIDTLDRPDQNIDAGIAGLFKRGRVWLLIVAGVDVLLVITSMVDTDGGEHCPSGWRSSRSAFPKAERNKAVRIWDLSLLVLTIIVCAAAVFVAAWSPGRDGRQWPLIRRLRKHPSGSDDELRGAVTDHDDGRVGSPAGEGRKHRAVDHP
ncbi:hypothetical protein ACVWWN_007334 [Mycobacterium sp. URHB0021]|jgi:hypothetical protein